MSRPQRPLPDLVAWLNEFFEIDRSSPDPSFRRHLPAAYDAIGFDWRSAFLTEFTTRFNGLMLAGDNTVGHIWLLSFPDAGTLDGLLGRAERGDLIFSHHPIDMRCGDPRGAKGAGFVPLGRALLDRMREQGVSYYSCHTPLDIHPRFSPSDAIVNAIGGTRLEPFLEDAGLLCEITPTPFAALADRCQRAIPLPYVEVVGQPPAADITRVAVVGGGAGNVRLFEAADQLGAECLITGEVTSKVDNEAGSRKQAEIDRYLPTTRLVGLGLSHAGSEFLVMKELAPFFAAELGLPATAVPENIWWR